MSDERTRSIAIELAKFVGAVLLLPFSSYVLLMIPMVFACGIAMLANFCNPAYRAASTEGVGHHPHPHLEAAAHEDLSSMASTRQAMLEDDEGASPSPSSDVSRDSQNAHVVSQREYEERTPRESYSSRPPVRAVR